MKYSKIVEEIINKFRLEDDNQKKKAYEACISYADKELEMNIDYNLFVNYAADLLNLEGINKPIIQRITESTGNEIIYLEYTKDNGPILTGNKDGLEYLGKLLINLSKSKYDGEHIHLWHGEFPVLEESYPLTLYKENEDWFKKNVKEPDVKEDKKVIIKRDLAAKDIIALSVTTHVPPTVPMTPLKLYRIKKCNKFKNQKVWQKEIREEKDRMFVFNFINDEGNDYKFAFDIDDTEIFFMTKINLEEIQ